MTVEVSVEVFDIDPRSWPEPPETRSGPGTHFKCVDRPGGVLWCWEWLPDKANPVCVAWMRRHGHVRLDNALSKKLLSWVRMTLHAAREAKKGASGAWYVDTVHLSLEERLIALGVTAEDWEWGVWRVAEWSDEVNGTPQLETVYREFVKLKNRVTRARAKKSKEVPPCR